MGNSLPGVGAIAENWREVLNPEEYAVGLRHGAVPVRSEVRLALRLAVILRSPG